MPSNTIIGRFATSSEADLFGSRLRELRKGAGMTQLDLAGELGVDHSMVSKWENGSHLPLENQMASLGRALADPMAADQLGDLWAREAQRRGHPTSRDVRPLDEVIEFIRQTISLTRTFRLLGNPTQGMRLASRDCAIAARWLRAAPWSKLQDEALSSFCELVLELIKCGLDFLPASQMHAPELLQPLSLLVDASNASSKKEAKFYRALAVEGLAHVVGDEGVAFQSSVQLISDLDFAPKQWRSELIRAFSINARLAGQKQFVEKGSRLTDSQMQLNEPPGNAYLLEGLARGWAPYDLEHSLQLLDLAETTLQEPGSSPDSLLRRVQLARTRLQIAADHADQSVLAFPESQMIGLAKQCEFHGYLRYQDQIASLTSRLFG